jgi:hypothetical protein
MRYQILLVSFIAFSELVSTLPVSKASSQNLLERDDVLLSRDPGLLAKAKALAVHPKTGAA